MKFLELLLLFTPPQDDVDSLIRALGSETIEERDRAAAALEKLGARALPALEKAERAEDAQIAVHARNLIFRINLRLFLTPEVERVDNPFAPFGRADHLQVTADEKLAAGCDLENLYVWTVPDGRLVHTWRPHREDIRSFRLSPRGDRVLTLGDSYDEWALWEFPSGKLIRRFETTGRKPSGLAAAPDGKHVALGGADNGVRWVETPTGRTVWQWFEEIGYYAVRDVDVSPDGRRVAVVGANGNRVYLLDAATGAVVVKFEAPGTGLYSRIRFTAGGKRVMVTNPDSAAAWLFDSESGTMEKETPLPGFVVVGPDDKRDHGNRKVLRLDASDSVEQAVPTPDGRHILVRTLNGKTVLRYELETGRKTAEIGSDVATFEVDSSGVLAGTRDGAVVLFDIDGKELRRASRGKGRIDRVAFAGGDLVLSLGEDHRLRCLDLARDRELWCRRYVPFEYGPFRFAPDGRQVVGAVFRNHSSLDVARWDVETGEVVLRYGPLAGYVAGVAVSRDGRRVAASGRDGPLVAWDAESGKKLWEVRPGRNARWLEFTPDGASLLAGDDEGRVVRYAAESGKIELLYRDKGPRVSEGAIRTDGRRFVVLGDAAPPDVYDLDDAEPVFGLGDRAYEGAAFLEGGKRVIYGSPPSLASGETGETIRRGDSVTVRRARFDSSQGRIGAVLGENRFVVTELATGRTLWSCHAEFIIDDFVLSRDADRVILHDGQGKIAGFEAGQDKPYVERTDFWIRGGDPDRGQVFRSDGTCVTVYDMKTLEVARKHPLQGVGAICVPSGADFALAVVGKQVYMLDRDTLQNARELKLMGDALGVHVHPTLGLFVTGRSIYDASQGECRGNITVSLPAPLVATAFSKDGRHLYAVLSNGLVVTLRRGP